MKFSLRRLFAREKAAVGTTDISSLVSTTSGGWFGVLREGFAGAWQRGIAVESADCLLAFSTVYACVDLIAADISKLRIKLVEFKHGVWVEKTSPAFSPVLRKPNRYQTRQQFISTWIVSKLLWGNAFVLKERDDRNAVVRLHVLDPRTVQIRITSEGDVYYTLTSDALSRVDGFTVPASEIIHSRAMCPFHPLIGVGPIYAAGVSATQGRKIQGNSSKFFENMSRPSGHLTSDGEISDETAERLKRDFEQRFTAENIGRLLVTGSGLKYEAMTMPAEQAQLIEQLGWTGEDCCRPFHVPLYKVGLGDPPTFNNVAQLAMEYYTECLQSHIEDIESLLDEGLGLDGVTVGTMFDIDALLRMDPLTRADYSQKLMQAGALAPDEARKSENLPPLPNNSGAEPYLQQQNFPISVLAKRTDVSPPVAAPAAPAPAPAATAAPAPAKSAPVDVTDDHNKAREFVDELKSLFEQAEEPEHV